MNHAYRNAQHEIEFWVERLRVEAEQGSFETIRRLHQGLRLAQLKLSLAFDAGAANQSGIDESETEKENGQ